MDRIWCLQFFGMFIEHLSSCHRRNNNIHLFVSLRTCAVAFCDFQASLFFFGIRLRPEARLTPFYDHTALKRAVNGLIS